MHNPQDAKPGGPLSVLTFKSFDTFFLKLSIHSLLIFLLILFFCHQLLSLCLSFKCCFPVSCSWLCSPSLLLLSSRTLFHIHDFKPLLIFPFVISYLSSAPNSHTRLQKCSEDIITHPKTW
uniref:Uncharacterized protein n=1 Tax=Rousettus aegyptiacus TaxID=9407 RepID=A0A7J8H203_ROUAE|nr:hypothetical protein HJG63_011253 [Rousettus aegyptiacus]